MGAPKWCSDAHTGSEELVEVAGRLCYKSFEPGMNPNVTKVREGNYNYMRNILQSGHGSVLEHSTVSFAFLNVTRVFTHEMVRHRTGTAFSQESLRYVRLEDLSAYQPDVFDDDNVDVMTYVFEVLEGVQKALGKKIENEKSFDVKKAFTSAMRRLAPIGLSTNIIVTANHRTWRHIIGMRCTAHAEEEIRKVMFDVAGQLKVKYPSIYQDLIMDHENGTAEFECGRV